MPFLAFILAHLQPTLHNLSFLILISYPKSTTIHSVHPSIQPILPITPHFPSSPIRTSTVRTRSLSSNHISILRPKHLTSFFNRFCNQPEPFRTLTNNFRISIPRAPLRRDAHHGEWSRCKFSLPPSTAFFFCAPSSQPCKSHVYHLAHVFMSFVCSMVPLSWVP